MGYIIIEDYVAEDNKLNSTDKLVYSIIKALANSKGYCYATNRYIADKYNFSKSTISNTISKLKKCNYIHTETVDYQRRIYMCDSTNNLRFPF